MDAKDYPGLNSDFVPHAGALRYKDVTGEWVYTNPHSPMYSTATMLATEYWGGSAWLPIFEDGDGSNVE